MKDEKDELDSADKRVEEDEDGPGKVVNRPEAKNSELYNVPKIA